ncbi:MAG: transglycosylase SLT domain-containing protein [bacterium]
MFFILFILSCVILFLYFREGIEKYDHDKSLYEIDSDKYYRKVFNGREWICIKKDYLYKLIKIAKDQINFDLSVEYIVAIIEKESSYRIKVVGDDGDSVGLMQISNICLKQVNEFYDMTFSKIDLYNERYNILVGMYYLKWLYDYYTDDYRNIYKGYNGGPSAIRHSSVQVDENNRRVLEIYERLKKENNDGI